MMLEEKSKNKDSIRLAMEILKRIPKGNPISASAIQQQLEAVGIKRDIRNIQKQLKMLCESFDELDCDSNSKPHSYRWKSHSKGFSIPSINEHEALLLSLAEQHLKNLLPSNLMGAMDGFFEQANKKILAPNTPSQLAREWQSKVIVVAESQRLIPPNIKEDVLKEISSALYANQWLEVDYKNMEDKANTYDVMPLGLAQQGARFYLVCRFKGHDGGRNLALHRIKKAKASPITFIRPPEFNLKKYDEEGRFGFGEGKKIKLSFNTTPKNAKYLMETPLAADQEEDIVDDYYCIRATVVDTGHLHQWLRGYGDGIWDVEVDFNI